MLYDEKFIYTNEQGASIEMSWFAVLNVVNYDDSLPVNYYTNKNAGQDGETLSSQSFDVRSLMIDCVYQVQDDIGAYERNLKRIFNPRLKGTLKHIGKDFEREISVKLNEIPTIKHSGGKGTLMLDFVAHAPFWQDVPVLSTLHLLRLLCRFRLLLSVA